MVKQATPESVRPARLPILIFALLCVAGLYGAYTLRWISDDIYVTFRYTQNFLEGKGPVYNPGEFVEGYSHFSWFAIITALQALRIPPERTVIALGLVCFAATMSIYFLISAKIRSGRWFVPMTSLALAAHTDMAIWATGGLETSFFTLTISAALYSYFFSSYREQTRLVISGVLLNLAFLTRPDGALFVIFVTALLVIEFLRARNRDALRKLILFNLPTLVMTVPYLIWKKSYYGDIFPNTYYAKAAYESYFSQGFYYLRTYFTVYRTSLMGLLVIPALFFQFRREDKVITRETAGAIVALSAAIFYLIFFVARVGGDFMFARFVVPVVPLLYFAAEYSIVHLLIPALDKTSKGKGVKSDRHAGALHHGSLSILILLIFPLVVFTERYARESFLFEREDSGKKLKHYSLLRGITDERWFYVQPFAQNKMSRLQLQEHIGKKLQPYFSGLDITLWTRGQNCLCYHIRSKRCIEGSGLTDEYIAHLPVGDRRSKRIGHEKFAPEDYLQRTGTDFLLARRTGAEQPPGYQLVYFILDDGMLVPAELITYDRKMLGELKARMAQRFRFVDFEKYLDQYLSSEIHKSSPPKLAADYEKFRSFYFAHNNDPKREEPFRKLLN